MHVEILQPDVKSRSVAVELVLLVMFVSRVLTARCGNGMFVRHGGVGGNVPDWRGLRAAAFSLPVSFRFTDKDEGIMPSKMRQATSEFGLSCSANALSFGVVRHVFQSSVTVFGHLSAVGLHGQRVV